MYKRVIFLSCLLIVVCVLQCIGDQKAASIDRPIWSKGDSWRVKCPIYSYSEYDIKIMDYYTLNVEVLDEENVRGQECYVLKINSQPDYVKTNEPISRYES